MLHKRQTGGKCQCSGAGLQCILREGTLEPPGTIESPEEGFPPSTIAIAAGAAAGAACGLGLLIVGICVVRRRRRLAREAEEASNSFVDNVQAPADSAEFNSTRGDSSRVPGEYGLIALPNAIEGNGYSTPNKSVDTEYRGLPPSAANNNYDIVQPSNDSSYTVLNPE